jgi:hypothetical protein
MKEKIPYDDYNVTQQYVADYFGTSRANAASFEKRAMEKFKIEFEKRGYKLEDLIGGMV